MKGIPSSATFGFRLTPTGRTVCQELCARGNSSTYMFAVSTPASSMLSSTDDFNSTLTCKNISLAPDKHGMIYCTMREMWDICSYIKVDPSTMFDGTIVVEDRDVIGDVSAAGRKHCVSLELSPEDAESIRELVAFCEGEVDGDVEGLVEIIDDAIDEYRRTYT